jgi:hypothetical protein
MLINVAPSAHIEKMTANSLRYGQLFAGSKRPSGGGGGGSRAAPAARALGGSAVAARPAAVAMELRAIYATHAPEKSDADVKRILASFAGREAELLSKVKAKYHVR